MKKIILWVFLLTGVGSTVFAEQFNRLNEDQGLSSRRCFSIRQDKNKFIWIANKLAIDRYDGRQLIRYELQSPPQHISANIGFNFVCLAPDSTVWAFTQPGNIYRYDEQSDAFLFVYSIRDHYQSYSVILNDLFFENSQAVLLATSKGILRLNLEEKKATNCNFMDGTDVYHITRQQNLYYFSAKTGLFIARFSEDNQGEIVRHLFENQFVNRIYYDSEYQQFWIGTFSGGMYILPECEGANITHVLPKINKPIRAIIPYNETQLAIGVDGEGVLLVNRQTMKIEQTFVQIENQARSLCGNSVWDLFLDSRDILWIASYHDGVSYTDHSNLKFNSFIHEKRNVNSISNNYINAVLEDKDGDLWFGTNNGLSILNRKTGNWKHYFQEQNLSNENVILTLCEEINGKIWAGGYAFGVAEIDKRSGVINKHKAGTSHPVIGTDYIYSIYRDEYSGNLWMGGIHGPISCYNPQTKQSRLYSEESLRCFSSYNDSIVILGLYRGLYLLNVYTGKKQETRINVTINNILKAGDQAYWIGTMMNGLYYYNLKNDSLRRYTKNDGLSSNHVYSIQKDEEDNLWIGTEEGLNKLSPETDVIINFNKHDGLISNQFIPYASVRCSTGEMLFGSADGAILFDPSEIKENNFFEHYPLIFTGFQLFGNPVKSGEKDSPLSLPINQTTQITLPHNKNYFSLTFTLPNYQSPDKTAYSCFLEGYDLDWSKPAAIHAASYSKIQPGNYTFIVKAYIDNLLQEERQIQIIVKQPWWNTIWAWLAYVFIVLATLYYTLKYYAELSKKKQTQEKMEFFINTAHDILTPLSLIEAPLKDISLVSALTEEVKYLLSLALSNTQKLSHFVHQLIDFQRIILNANHLVVTRNNLRGFFMNKENDYQMVASQKFISLNVRMPDQAKEIFFDREKINKIIDNLLSNAIKYTPFGGKIEIGVSLLPNGWSFSVKDTGVGIPQRNQNLIFKHIFRADNDINARDVGSGVGLKMVHALVRIHHGRISFTSKKGEGSEFVVSLPYQYDEKYIDTRSPATTSEEFFNPEEPANLRILIVESEPEMSAYLHNSFSREYSVESYATGTEAFNRIVRFQPRLIIANSSISDMDGFSFCKRIKDNVDTSHIPVLMITDLSETILQKKAFSSGASDFIKKPFELEILKLKISNLLSLQQIWQNKALSDIKKNNISVINNDRDRKFMDNLIQLIEKNLENPDLNIAMLCKELASSKTLLYNRITQLTNNSPNEFIRIIRLKNAANLLISGKYSITEVSNRVGIDNPKYFSRIFKEYYKVSPKNYLKDPLETHSVETNKTLPTGKQ